MFVFPEHLLPSFTFVHCLTPFLFTYFHYLVDLLLVHDHIYSLILVFVYHYYHFLFLFRMRCVCCFWFFTLSLDCLALSRKLALMQDETLTSSYFSRKGSFQKHSKKTV